jgi:GNAT superfamily N-acetyltransferase
MFVDRRLAARLEAVQAWRAVNYTRAHARLNPGCGARFEFVGGAPVVYAAPDLPVNRAIGLGMQGPVTPDDLDQIEAFYATVGLPSRVDLCPLADPSLVEVTAARGYRVHGWMNMLLLPLPAPPVLPPTPEITITHATPDQFDLWLETSCHGFSDSPDPDPVLRKILIPNFAAEHAHVYLAWREGVPIATGAIYIHDGVAELGGTSTLPAYRRRGAQTALIRRRLADAHALGCDVAAVLTGPGSDSQRNLQGRGFALAYTRALAHKPQAPA